MAMADKPAPKIQVGDKFGGIRQIALDTNTTETTGETLFRVGNIVAFQSHAIYSDALMWILIPAVSLRAIMHLVAYGIVPMTGGVVALAFLLFPPLIVIAYVGGQLSNTHGGAAFYRFFLILAGVLLASM